MPVKAVPEMRIESAWARWDFPNRCIQVDLSPGGLNYVTPYPGWRFRFDPSGVMFHEPDPDAAKAA